MDEYLRNWACKQPNRIAVDGGEQRLSYQELDEYVNRLAAELSRKGCRPGDRIGLVMPHGPEMVVAMLASLRARVTYIPLDPTWPSSRLLTILSECAPVMLVIDVSLAYKSEGITSTPFFIWDSFSFNSSGTASISSPAAGLAYILFTSGSSGKPKGVVQSRHALVANAEAYAKSIHLTRNDRVSVLAPYIFDASVMDIFGALVAGATLLIHDPRGGGLVTILSWLLRNRISVCHLTPTLFRAMMSNIKKRIVSPSLRILVFGGEAVFSRDVELARHFLPRKTLLVNGYGPTECTIVAQYHIGPDTAISSNRVPIGTSVEGVTISLRSNDGVEVIGEGSGEIVLHGTRVALGYWNPIKIHSFGSFEGPRTFATGDLATRLPSGELVHLGRKDAQVKINGCRVEPIEVEAQLLAIPGVIQAVVSAYSKHRTTRLAAWFVCALDGKPHVLDVRRNLRERLPEYMIPTVIYSIREMPLLSTGKIDRLRLLESLEQNKPGINTSTVFQEDLIVQIWLRTLEVNNLSYNDNFFALGGDSLQALQVQLESEEVIGCSLPSLFTHPTISAFLGSMKARIIRRERKSRTKQVTAPLSPQQRRYWARIARNGDDGEFNIGFIIEIRGRLYREALVRAFSAIVRQHEVFRIGISLQEGVPIQVVDIGCAVELSSKSIGHDQDYRQWRKALLDLAEKEVRYRFNLANSGLLRAQLVRRTETHHALVLSFHHLIMDSWARLLFEKALFRQYAQELTTSMSATKVVHSYLLASKALASRSEQQVEQFNLKAGTSDLGDIDDPAMRLPGKTVQVTHQDRRSKSLSIRLGKQRWGAILSCAQTFNTTPFVVLASLFAIALTIWTGEPRVVITTDHNSRDRDHLDIIGLFADTAVIAINFTSNDSFVGILLAIHDRVASLQSPGTIPFSDLVERRWPGQLGRYDEIFPVAISLEQREAWHVQDGGVKVRTHEVSSGSLSRTLLLNSEQCSGDIVHYLIYRPSRLSRASVARLARILLKLHDWLTFQAEKDWPISVLVDTLK